MANQYRYGADKSATRHRPRRTAQAFPVPIIARPFLQTSSSGREAMPIPTLLGVWSLEIAGFISSDPQRRQKGGWMVVVGA